MRYFYDVHVEIPKHGYSFGLQSDKELTDEEVIQLAVSENKFEESDDFNFVDSIELISEEEFNEWFNKN